MARFALTLCIAFGLSLGCDSEGDDGENGENTSEDVTEENSDVMEEEPMSYPGTASIVDFATGDPIEGAEVCIAGSDEPCLTSDAEGVVSFEYTANTDTTMTIAVDGYWTARVSGSLAAPEEGAESNMVVQMAANGVVDLLASQAPGGAVEISADHGHIVLGAGNGSEEAADNPDLSWVADVTFTMTPVSGLGPYYFASGDALANAAAGTIYDADATATTDAGLANVYNMEPGVYTITATHETMECFVFYGLPTDGEGFTVEVVAGQLSYGVVVCL